MFSKEVKTPNGTVKNVVAGSEQELAAAVEAVSNEPKVVAPNIDNPDHGNVVVADFVADQEKALKERPAEHFPTSDESKEVSRELADLTREERREFVNEGAPSVHDTDGNDHVDEDQTSEETGEKEKVETDSGVDTEDKNQ